MKDAAKARTRNGGAGGARRITESGRLSAETHLFFYLSIFLFD